MANTLLLNIAGDTTRNIITAINRLIRGKSNNVMTVTLTPSAMTTTMTFADIESGSAIVLTPLTANAAAALATTYVSSQTQGSAIITHTNNAQIDRTFRVAIIG